MATFLTGNELNATLEKMLDTASEYIMLISPYIKLHDRFASVLREKKELPNLKITVVFGKNENDFSKSMKQDDFNFFKEFPNIEIRFEKRLHAKYYATQDAALLTSMNLYNYSQDNNIEVGILIQRNGLLGSLTTNLVTNVTGQDSLENQSTMYFDRVIKQAELLYLKVPHFESAMLGFSKKYTGSTVEADALTTFFNEKQKAVTPSKIVETPKQVPASGYCIRTGVAIPFNQKHPMSDAAYQSWKKFSNAEFPEKYCHFSGEFSNGDTSFARPILRKNWIKAKETYRL